MSCKFCNEEAIDVEEYCHHCGVMTCFGCLEDEWCPGCRGNAQIEQAFINQKTWSAQFLPYTTFESCPRKFFDWTKQLDPNNWGEEVNSLEAAREEIADMCKDQHEVMTCSKDSPSIIAWPRGPSPEEIQKLAALLTENKQQHFEKIMNMGIIPKDHLTDKNDWFLSEPIPNEDKKMHSRFDRTVLAYREDFTAALAKQLVLQSPKAVPDNLVEILQVFDDKLDKVFKFGSRGEIALDLSTAAHLLTTVLEEVIGLTAVLEDDSGLHQTDCMPLAQNIVCEFVDAEDAEAYLDSCTAKGDTKDE